MADTRERVLALFEAHREKPGAPFEESHFLDFLLAEPRQHRAIYDSFKGLRRFNAFLRQLQWEFAIFLSSKDRDANSSLNRFVERVDELRGEPASSLASLRRPMRGKVEGIVLVGLLLFWLPAVALRDHIVIASALFACGIALLVFFLLIYRRERNYLARLHQKIKEASESDTQPRVAADGHQRESSADPAADRRAACRDSKRHP
jgi:hypothetical protein